MRCCRSCCRRICVCGTEARAGSGFGRPALTLSCLLLAGISNLTNRIYYSRVFLAGGQLEPALERQGYAGLACDF
jgi:hypothetical protein